MNNALGSSVDVNALGSGISISNVRRADAATFVAASLIVLLAFFINPVFAHAQDGQSQLTWGDATYDYFTGDLLSSDQISMQDGGTYAVPIGVSKGALVQIQNIQNGEVSQYPSAGYGPLYFLPDPAHSTERDLITNIGGYSGTSTLAWEKPGTYELDVYKIQFSVGDNVPYWEGIVHFFVGMPAYAQVADPPYQTIRFTIVDENMVPKESNVLFIPGTESSRLYQNTTSGEQKIWEPALLGQPGVEALDLNPDGTSITPTYTKANGALDTIAQGPWGISIPFVTEDIYKTFLQQLAQLKASSTIADYLVFPYDWRMSPEDVVNNGTAYDDGIHHLDTELVALAATSRTGKVTIVAHSNGGLVAKALMNKLVQEGKGNLVDKIILVAVPQDGTPAAISVLLHGDQTGIPPYVVSQATARGLGQYMPDAYDLLPSAAYFSRVSTPVVDLTNAPGLRSTAGFASKTIMNIGNLQKFLTGAGGRTQPDPSNVEIPEVLSKTILAGATSLHNDLDSWQPPAGVQVIQIAGWGVDTASGVVYTESNEPDCTYAITCTTATTTRHMVSLTEDGDGTVVTPSAVATTSWQSYYVDLRSYNDAFKTNFSHADITEIPNVQNLLQLLLASSSPEVLPTYVTSIEPVASSNEESLRLRVLSPVTLDAFDSSGNHTGIVPGQNPNAEVLVVDEQIPGSYYQRYGEGQYIGLPASGTYNVKLHGTGTGTFTFEITPVSEDTAGTPISFSGIPVTASSTVAINVNGANPASTSLVVDENGDGKTDITIASSTQAADPLAYTKIMFTSILGMDIGPIVKIPLEAKIVNAGYLIARSTLWDNDDGDAKDTNTKDILKVRVLRKLNLIETYVENEVTKPKPKLLKAEQISLAQGTQILDMIEELKTLVNAKL